MDRAAELTDTDLGDAQTCEIGGAQLSKRRDVYLVLLQCFQDSVPHTEFLQPNLNKPIVSYITY